jgi:hypothetical protein
MTDDLITITAGAPQSDIAPGVYVVTLTDISEPRTILPQTGVNAGKEVTLRDWTFALEDGSEVRGSASTASGPKSKTFAWLTALLGGQPPQVGQSYPRTQLVGRMALATISVDEGGWPKIANLSALPASMVTGGVPAGAVAAAPTAAPVAAPPAAQARPVAQPVAQANAADLPF